MLAAINRSEWFWCVLNKLGKAGHSLEPQLAVELAVEIS